ncbi:hypothetical protein DD238_000181 [Peronospora effusa]|uniref:Uncharacterized protein n=1 Tax=Peronospora effusa TaxID=542832 RepID=A0A3M6VVC5_9STRA|nr:hypothetical protein DD238_000181 [Peronospora effusa]
MRKREQDLSCGDKVALAEPCDYCSDHKSDLGSDTSRSLTNTHKTSSVFVDSVQEFELQNKVITRTIAHQMETTSMLF